MPEPLVPTPPENPVPNLEPVDALISEVASLTGQPDDAAVREEALSALVRAAARMNAAGIWLAARTVGAWTVAASPSSDSEYADGAESLTLPSDWAWPALGALLYDSSGNVAGSPTWESWHVYRSYTTRNTSSQAGTPEILCIRSPEEQTVYLWPPVDGEAITRIELPYYRRIATFTSQDTLFLSPESREALIAGGEYFVMKRRHKTNPAVLAAFFQDFQVALRGAKAADERANRVIGARVIPLEVSWGGLGNIQPGTSYTIRV